MEIVKDMMHVFSEISKYNTYRTVVELFGPVGFSEQVFNPMYFFLNMLMSMFVIMLYKHFFMQSAVLVRDDKIGIFKNGVVLYSVIFFLIAMFFLSVVGYGISILFIIGLLVLISIGRTSFAIAIGGKITNYKNIYLDMVIGYVIMEALKLLPYIDWVFTAVLVPIISVGIVGAALRNMYFNRKYCESPYQQKVADFDRDKMYDIILGSSIKREGD